jgi:hypothetical protein
MSRQNKVNKDHYVQRGRLTPDEMARERMRQTEVSGRATGKDDLKGKAPQRDAQASTRPRSAPEE